MGQVGNFDFRMLELGSVIDFKTMSNTPIAHKARGLVIAVAPDCCWVLTTGGKLMCINQSRYIGYYGISDLTKSIVKDFNLRTGIRGVGHDFLPTGVSNLGAVRMYVRITEWEEEMINRRWIPARGDVVLIRLNHRAPEGKISVWLGVMQDFNGQDITVVTSEGRKYTAAPFHVLPVPADRAGRIPASDLVSDDIEEETGLTLKTSEKRDEEFANAEVAEGSPYVEDHVDWGSLLVKEKTQHPYYCEAYSSKDTLYYDTWGAFEDVFSTDTLDHDYNFLVRYDLSENTDADDQPTGSYTLLLFYIQQRKGKFVPVVIAHFEKENFPALDEYLKTAWQYMQTVWTEHSGVSPKE